MAVTGPVGETRTRRAKLSGWLDARTDREFFLVLLAPVLALYLLTATYSYPVINDSFTNSATAWSLANRGSVYLDDFADHQETYGFISWITETSDGRIVSKYPPGASLVAAPLYALWPQDVYPITYQPEGIQEKYRTTYPVLEQQVTRIMVPLPPGSVAAALSTAVAVGLLGVLFRRLSGSTGLALGAALVFALGTSAWSVAADQLWQHGPAMMWIALALVLSEHQLLGSGFAFAGAILTRPPLAIIAAGTGLFRSWRERSVRPAVVVGAGALSGLVVFLAYNGLVFGDPSVSAGYGSGFQDNVLSGFDVARYLRTLFDALLSREVGVLVYSPFLLVLLPGMRAAWRVAPSWVKGSAMGGVLYLLVQYKANRATGGSDFIGYRYPLEALVAAAPLFFLAYVEGVSQRLPLKRPLVLAVGVALLIQGLGAVGVSVVR